MVENDETALVMSVFVKGRQLWEHGWEQSLESCLSCNKGPTLELKY